MAAETGYGYLFNVVRSGARPFFAPAQRAGRATSPHMRSAAPNANATEAAHLVDVTHEVSEPAIHASESLLATTPRAQPLEHSPTIYKQVPPHEQTASHEQTVTHGHEQTATHEQASIHERAEDEMAAAGLSSERHTRTGPLMHDGHGLTSGMDAQVSSGFAGHVTTDEAAAQDALSAESGVGDDLSDGVDFSNGGGIDVWPRAQSMAESHARRGESLQTVASEIRPAEEETGAVEASSELQASRGLQAARESNAPPASEVESSSTSNASTSNASTASSSTTNASVTSSSITSSATAHADEQKQRDEEASAAPLLRHTRGETVVRLPSMFGRMGRASRVEQNQTDLVDARKVLDEKGRDVASQRGAEADANGMSMRPAPAEVETGNAEAGSSATGVEAGRATSRVSPGRSSGVKPGSSLKSYQSNTARESYQSNPAGESYTFTPAMDSYQTKPTSETAGALESTQAGTLSPVGDAPQVKARARASNADAMQVTSAQTGATVARTDAMHVRTVATHAQMNATPAQMNATPAPMEATPVRTAETASAQGRSASVGERDGARAARKGDGGRAPELLPAESKRPRVREGRAGRDASAGEGSAPKVTINRLDVRIVNQTPPAPVVPTPPAPAPSSKRDSWESLDRGHLGRLFLL
jgi:hypothetical protein